MIEIISQYLNDQGYHASRMTLLDEACLKTHEKEDTTVQIRRLKKAVIGKNCLPICIIVFDRWRLA